MPRNVRNFWVTVEVDGRERVIASGPASADGGLRCRFYIRHKGAVVPALDVDGYADGDGELTLDAVLRGDALREGLAGHSPAIHLVAQR